ncbi:glycoside hydrolase family 108 protein [Wielerella bovis]|uniref:glycoside hydrolase family 108 protein n=1 Tax=Wielerella bovis TaxID=2917790 RepID=UPI002018C573|nr:glycoside hydrolase family 108 protein [Wielerella bovis]ULJ66642.1 glycoside hydrolase family 108 protein [Wielerella bovis]
MNINFNTFINRVLSHEGGYVNHPKDPGGETNWGVTKRTALQNGYTGAMRNMTREQAIEIYRQAFWERYHADKMPDAVAFQFFDACINHGYGNAARMLQRAANVLDDGVIGPISLNAINTQPENDLLLKFNAERLMFYTKLGSFGVFGKGWVRRVAENLLHAASDNVDEVVETPLIPIETA